MPYLLQSDRKRPDGAIRCALHSLSYEHEGSLSTLRSIFLHQRIVWKLLEMARYQEAERLLNQTLIASQRIFGEQNNITASITLDFAELHNARKNYAEAERLYQSAYSISVACDGREHPFTIMNLERLATFYWLRRRRLDEAERLQTEVVEIRERLLGPAHPDTVTSIVHLADIYSAQRRFLKAKALYHRAVRICRADRHYDRETTARVLRELADYYRKRKRYRKAEALSLEAYEILQSKYGHEHPYTIFCLNDLAHHYRETGKSKRGEKILLETSPLLAKTLGAEHPQYINELTSLARFYSLQHKYVKSLSVWIEALDISRRTFGDDHPITTEIADELEDNRKYRERAVERCRKKWIPRLKTKKSQIVAALIGFMFGGIGLGLYFRSLVDFLIPTLVFFIMFLISPPHAILVGPLVSIFWGMKRAEESCDDQCQCRAICIR